VPNERPWHISARVDTLAYAFSWTPPLAVLALFGEHFAVRAAVFIGVNVISDVHRFWTFGYAFLAPEVRGRSRARFLVLPLALLACALACPLLLALDRGRALLGPGLSVDAAIDGLALAAGAWNVYHVLAQKYGLLRVYAGKLGGRAAPRAADRALVFAPLLLVPAWLLPEEARAVTFLYPTRWAIGALAFLVRARLPLLALAFGTTVIAAAWFFLAERRANRLSSRPRLTLAVGTLLLCASFLVLRPLYAYLAFAFSHAVEYMVFVSAFLRRRAEHAEDWLGRVTRSPALSYGVFSLGLGALILATGPWLPTLWPQLRWRLLGGDGPNDWVRPWMLFSSLLHFYYDGILWKLRRAEVARDLWAPESREGTLPG
jgi:hypothetical protein